MLEGFSNLVNALLEIITGIDIKITIGLIILLCLFATGIVSMINTDAATAQQIAANTTTQVVNQGSNLVVDSVYGLLWGLILTPVLALIFWIINLFN
jgi:hypothetical protein